MEILYLMSVGDTVSMLASILVLLIAGGYFYYIKYEVRQKKNDSVRDEKFQKSVGAALHSIKNSYRGLTMADFRRPEYERGTSTSLREEFIAKYGEKFESFEVHGIICFPKFMSLLEEYFDSVQVMNKWIVINHKGTHMTSCIIELQKAQKIVTLSIRSLEEFFLDLIQQKDTFEEWAYQDEEGEKIILTASGIDFMMPPSGYELKRKNIQDAINSSLIAIKKREIRTEGYFYYLSRNRGKELYLASSPIDKLKVAVDRAVISGDIAGNSFVGLAEDITPIIAKMMVESTWKPNVLIAGNPGTGKTSWANRLASEIFKLNPEVRCIMSDQNGIETVLSEEFKHLILGEQDNGIHGHQLVVFLDDAHGFLSDPQNADRMKAFLEGAPHEGLGIQFIITSDVPFTKMQSAIVRPGRAQIKIVTTAIKEPLARQIATDVAEGLDLSKYSYNWSKLDEVFQEDTETSPKQHATIDQIFSKVVPKGIEEEIKDMMSRMKTLEEGPKVVIEPVKPMAEEKSNTQKEMNPLAGFSPIIRKR